MLEPKTTIAFDITNLRIKNDRHARNFASLPAFVIEKVGNLATNSGSLDKMLIKMAGYFQGETEHLGKDGFGYAIAVVPESVRDLLVQWNTDPEWLNFKFIPDKGENMYALTPKMPPADDEIAAKVTR